LTTPSTDAPSFPSAADRRDLVILDPHDASEPWADSLVENALRARELAAQRLGLKLEGPVRILTVDSPRQMEDLLGTRPDHVLAMASHSRMRIVILRPNWLATDVDRQQRTLVHEMTHLIVGRNARGRLPAWLNEGLAMIVAGEDRSRNHWHLTAAGVLGTLIPLEDLENGVLMGGERQRLAYAQSASVTEFLLMRSYDGREGMDTAVRRLAEQLADPQRGPRLLERLHDRHFRLALEIQWRRQFESIWGWISFVTGAAFIWMAISALFLLAYWRKRRMARLIRERFEEEEFNDDPPASIDHLLVDDAEDDGDWR
jgi:hypothetical protein